MKYKYLLLLIFLTVFFPLSDACACTSFAVHSQQVYYGMNFDFATLPMKFLISVNGDIRTFHLAFERTFGDVKFFVNTAGMNDKGLFSSCQELHPINEHPREKTDDNMYTFELYEKMAFCRSVDEIKKLGRGFPLVDLPGVTVHNFFADASGRAIVTEATESETAIIEKQGEFMVMTNFPNISMAGKSYTEARGKGDKRYIICHEYLEQHSSDFSIEKGFELLSLCKNMDPLYPTTCSMIFDPQKLEVFIVLERNFSKILKVSINEGTIETFKGYENNTVLSIPVGTEGLLVDTIQKAIP